MGSGNIRIGACREGDIGEMVAIEQDSFPCPWSEALFLHELKNPIARMLVARLDRSAGELVAGYVVYWRVADEMHLHNIAVRKEDRRQKVAFRLLREAIHASQSEGLKTATLEVRRSNIPAQRLYGHFGFSLAGVRRGYYTDTGEDALIFRAELNRVPPESALATE